MAVSRKEFNALRQQVDHLYTLVVSLQDKYALPHKHVTPYSPPPRSPPRGPPPLAPIVMSKQGSYGLQLCPIIITPPSTQIASYSHDKTSCYKTSAASCVSKLSTEEPRNLPQHRVCSENSIVQSYQQPSTKPTADYYSDAQAFKDLKVARDQIISAEIGRQGVNNIAETAWLARFLHAGAQEDVTIRNTLLLAFSKDFIRHASTRVRIILQEMNIPTHKRSILPLKVGGFAGGTKYLDHNILFKFANDPKKRGGTHLYGGLEPDLERAAKAAANDLKGADAYFRCFTLFGHIPIIVPPQVLLDFNGFRLIAMPWLPLQTAELVYGSSDEGKTVHDSDPVLRAAIKFSAHHLHLALHPVKNQILYAAGDVEGHKDAEGRFYLIDLSRTFPPEDSTCSNHLEQPQSAIFFRMHRAEYMDYLKSNKDLIRFPRLSPDSFSLWGELDAGIHNGNTRLATEHLVRVRIPALVAFLRGSKQLPLNFGSILHHWGVSIRHLGLIRAIVRGPNEEHSPLEVMLLASMVQRCCKNLLRQDLREAALSKNVNDTIAVFFNALMRHSTDESISFWTVKLPKDLCHRFGSLAISESEADCLLTLCKPYLMPIMRYVCAQTGISLALEYNQLFTRDSVLSTSVRSTTFSALEALLHEDYVATACESKSGLEFAVALTKLARNASGHLAYLIANVDDLEKVEKIFHQNCDSVTVKNVYLSVLAALALFFGGHISENISDFLSDQWVIVLVPRLPQIFAPAQIEKFMTTRLRAICREQHTQLDFTVHELLISLIDAKADPNARGSDTGDPLLLDCIIQGSELLVATLLECKANYLVNDGFGTPIDHLVSSYYLSGTPQFRIRESLALKGIVGSPRRALLPVRVRVHSVIVVSPRLVEGFTFQGGLSFRMKLANSKHRAPIKACSDDNKNVLPIGAAFMFNQWGDREELQCSVACDKKVIAVFNLQRPSKPFQAVRSTMIAPIVGGENLFTLVADVLYLAPEAKIASLSSLISSHKRVFDQQAIIILGATASGKTTLFKRLCCFPCSSANKTYYRNAIQKNVIEAVNTLIQGANARLYSTLADNACSLAFIEHINYDKLVMTPALVLPHLVAALSDPGIQKTLLDRTFCLLPVCANVFFPKISEIFASDYVPSDQDILTCSVRTIGISESVTRDGFSVFDVGGSKLEQKNWILLYEHATCVIFTVNLTSYDPVSQDGLSEPHALWRSVVTNSAFNNRFIILLFTFNNTLRQKINYPAFKEGNFSAEMKDAPHDSYAQAAANLATRFVSHLDLDPKRIRSFFVDLLDEASYDDTMRGVWDFLPQLANKAQ